MEKELSNSISLTFQIHGSKLKLDPSCDAGQASVVGITHGVFFFCVGEDPLDRFLAHGV